MPQQLKEIHLSRIQRFVHSIHLSQLFVLLNIGFEAFTAKGAAVRKRGLQHDAFAALADEELESAAEFFLRLGEGGALVVVAHADRDVRIQVFSGQ